MCEIFRRAIWTSGEVSGVPEMDPYLQGLTLQTTHPSLHHKVEVVILHEAEDEVTFRIEVVVDGAI